MAKAHADLTTVRAANCDDSNRQRKQRCYINKRCRNFRAAAAQWWLCKTL